MRWGLGGRRSRAVFAEEHPAAGENLPGTLPLHRGTRGAPVQQGVRATAAHERMHLPCGRHHLRGGVGTSGHDLRGGPCSPGVYAPAVAATVCSREVDFAGAAAPGAS